MATALRPLNTGELLDRTFSLYRTHFALFFGISALPHLVLLAYQLLGVGLQPSTTELSVALWTILWAIGAILISLVVTATAHAATIMAVSQVYLDRPASVMDSFSRVKHQILGVIGLSLAVGILTGLGFIFCIVPGVLLMLIWSLAVPAKVLENLSVSDAMTRSSSLTQGNRVRIFVIWLLFVVLSFGVAMLLQSPITIAMLAMGKNAPHWIQVGMQVATPVAQFFSQCLVGPLLTISFSLVYYDERVRKEAFDLELMMTTLDGGTVQAPLAQAGA